MVKSGEWTTVVLAPLRQIAIVSNFGDRHVRHFDEGDDFGADLKTEFADGARGNHRGDLTPRGFDLDFGKTEPRTISTILPRNWLAVSIT